MQSADSDQAFPGKNFSHKAFSEDEKFELLSAYLDGEVNETEYQLVIGWIASDHKVARHYKQQLKLRQALKSLSPAFLTSARTSKHLSSEQVPPSEHTSEEKPQRNQFSTNAYTPYSALKSQPLIHRKISNGQISNGKVSQQLNIAMCDLTASSHTGWRQGLLALAVLGATAVTLSTTELANRRRPINLNRLKEPLSGQTHQGSMTAVGLKNQHPYGADLTRGIHPVFTTH